MALGFDWRDPDRWLNIENMRMVLMDNGMTVQTEDRRNSVGKNEVHFWISRNGRTLHRILYEYDLGSVQNIQDHRRHFLKEIIDSFETAEKADVARVHIMGICEMLAKLDDRGFKAKSDYDPRKKVYKIHAHKGDWHCVREVEWCDVLDDDQATVASHARRRQDTLENIFEAYKEYERKRILNLLYGSCPMNLESQYVWVTTAGFGSSTVFKEHLQKLTAEMEKDMKNNEHTLIKDDWTTVNMCIAKAKKTTNYKLPEIKKVIFNNPATIVIWADDTKTIVKAQNNELFDPEKGLAMAITKKALGNEGRYFDTIKKWVDEYENRMSLKKLISRLVLKKYAAEDAARDDRYVIEEVLKNKKATKADMVDAMQKAIHHLDQWSMEQKEQENEN